MDGIGLSILSRTQFLVKNLADFIRQRYRVEWLLDEGRVFVHESTVRECRFRVSRHKDYSQAGVGSSQFGEQLETSLPGHYYVGHQQIDGAAYFLEKIESLRDVC